MKVKPPPIIRDTLNKRCLFSELCTLVVFWGNTGLDLSEPEDMVAIKFEI